MAGRVAAGGGAEVGERGREDLQPRGELHGAARPPRRLPELPRGQQIRAGGESRGPVEDQRPLPAGGLAPRDHARGGGGAGRDGAGGGEGGAAVLRPLKPAPLQLPLAPGRPQ